MGDAKPAAEVYSCMRGGAWTLHVQTPEVSAIPCSMRDAVTVSLSATVGGPYLTVRADTCMPRKAPRPCGTDA